jgi:LysM repeat protein
MGVGFDSPARRCKGNGRSPDRSRRDRTRSLAPRIRLRQCAGGTRLAPIGGNVPDREGQDLKDDWTPAADDLAGEPLPQDASDALRPALPILDDASRSPNPAVCPFFRREVDGKLFAPLEEPDEHNRCAAIGSPRPQSTRQQELVCLTAAHADCPRYLRGAMLLAEPPPRKTPTVPRATLAALLILVLSAGISFGFVLQRGGIDLPVAAATATPSQAALVETPTPAAVVDTPTPEPTQAPSPTVLASATPAPTPVPTPSPTVTPTPTPVPTPTTQPTSDRYALLVPCPDKPDCWIYTVRAGDNLFSIANYFGVPLATIYSWNPQYADGAGLRAGDQIRMPPPTR